MTWYIHFFFFFLRFYYLEIEYSNTHSLDRSIVTIILVIRHTSNPNHFLLFCIVVCFSCNFKFIWLLAYIVYFPSSITFLSYLRWPAPIFWNSSTDIAAAVFDFQTTCVHFFPWPADGGAPSILPLISMLLNLLAITSYVGLCVYRS